MCATHTSRALRYAWQFLYFNMCCVYCVQSVRTRAVLSVLPVVGSWPLLLFVTRLHYSLLLPHLLYYTSSADLCACASFLCWQTLPLFQRALVCEAVRRGATRSTACASRSHPPRLPLPLPLPCLLFTLTLFVGESTDYSYLSCELLRFVELLVSLRLPHCAEPSH